MSLPLQAQTVLTGSPEQGGLVLGQTSPGARVSLDGRDVPVAADGLFLLGFGRDAAEAARLVIEGTPATEERLLVVARRDWPVQKVEGLPRDKAEPDPVAVARIKAESQMMRDLRGRPTPLAQFLSGLERPATGIVSGVFGSQRFYNGNPGAPHSGLDIAGPTGSPVRAAADGVVVLAAPDLFLTGRTVMIDHGLGLMSSYAHLSAIAVTAGQRVIRGQPIGAIGASGLATGAHLHWGMSWQEVRLDPVSVEKLLRR
ncbi:peptidase M23 [Paramagnetospirillum marisnigri]|uniref:Peptidase M23 n=1 Tax=Paramagnetospirillum marisnigri TaxID=1285242 RepID=A0A178MUG5_9PROT|nr:peptidase M23 [Paramagnetospirillum marisnigri]